MKTQIDHCKSPGTNTVKKTSQNRNQFSKLGAVKWTANLPHNTLTFTSFRMDQHHIHISETDQASSTKRPNAENGLNCAIPLLTWL